MGIIRNTTTNAEYGKLLWKLIDMQTAYEEAKVRIAELEEEASCLRGRLVRLSELAREDA